MRMFICQAVQTLFFIYTSMLVVTAVGSWLPELSRYRWMQFFQFYTLPYFSLFRRLIPPLGGTVDLSPILAFIALRFLEKLILRVLCF